MRGAIVIYSAKVGRLTLKTFPLLLFTKSLSFLPIISLCEMSPLSHVGVSISLLAPDANSTTVFGVPLFSETCLVLFKRSMA